MLSGSLGPLTDAWQYAKIGTKISKRKAELDFIEIVLIAKTNIYKDSEFRAIKN